MADIDTIKAMLDRAAVVYEVDEGAIHWSADVSRGAATAITVCQGDGPNNIGYGQFSTSFFFNAAGDLTHMGAWE